MGKCTKAWTLADMPSQKGKVAIVTGGTGGLGYETAVGLAQAGATVIIAGRSEEKGKDSIGKIMMLHPDAKVEFGKVDLLSLASVAEFATTISKKYEALDILVNNAGVMALPKRDITKDGFEIQLGTNYLSHFALTAHLLPILRKSSGPARVVNVSSMAARQGKINFGDLQSEKCSYGWNVYGQSKLAMLIFGLELQRRSDAAGWGLQSITAHPGIARTDLISNGPGDDSWLAFFSKYLGRLHSQSAADGALPQLFAATSPDAQPGGYYGPNGFMEMKGAVGPAGIVSAAKDTNVAAKFWDVSSELTKVNWS